MAGSPLGFRLERGIGLVGVAVPGVADRGAADASSSAAWALEMTARETRHSWLLRHEHDMEPVFDVESSKHLSLIGVTIRSPSFSTSYL
jgi:hypothetical protein